MIKLIYGPKGAGKTKHVIDDANKVALQAKGDIVFLDKNNRKMFEISRKIRLVDTAEYNINGECELSVFIKGLIAGNRDIEHIYIDGLSAMIDRSAADSKTFYDKLEEISKAFEVKFTVTVSTENLPEYLTKYEATNIKAI